MTTTSESLKLQLETLVAEARSAIECAPGTTDLEVLRVHYLGKKGVEKGAELGTKGYEATKDAAKKGHDKAKGD